MAWRGRTVRDREGDDLGKLNELYLDSESSRPAWASVKRGLLRTSETIVPLSGAEEDGGDLRLPYERALFDDAPDIDPDVELSPEQEQLLHEHYGREWEEIRLETDPAPEGSIESVEDVEEAEDDRRS